MAAAAAALRNSMRRRVLVSSITVSLYDAMEGCADATGCILHVDAADTDEELRRLGLFRLLLGKALRHHQRARACTICVHTDNMSAQRAYTHVGFEKVSEADEDGFETWKLDSDAAIAKLRRDADPAAPPRGEWREYLSFTPSGDDTPLSEAAMLNRDRHRLGATLRQIFELASECAVL